MTRDKALKIATECGNDNGTTEMEDLGFLVRFAKAVAAAEREACAAICDAEGREWDSDDVVTENNYAAHCAQLIRGGVFHE